jgi:hypothetical protein
VFVREAGATSLDAAQGLEEMLAVALRAARRKGFALSDIRAVVERWLAAAPPARVVTVDPSLAMAELLAAEVRPAVSVPVEARGLREVLAAPALLDGALTVSLPHYVAALQRAAPRSPVFKVTLEVPAFRDAILSLPKGSIALVVSHAETVLPFASTLIRSLRGDEVLVETHREADGRDWHRLLPAADVVFADVLAASAVAERRPRRLQAIQVLDAGELSELAAAARGTTASPAVAAEPASPKPARTAGKRGRRRGKGRPRRMAR